MNTVTVHVRAGQVADRRMFSPPARSRRRTQPAIIEVEFGPACPADTAAKDHRNLAQVLGSSQTFRDYQRAFGEVTGLPLTLRPVIAWQLAHQGGRHQNAFCALIAQANRCCSACLQMQQRVCEGATGAARTLKCALGINETAVAVKIGETIVGYLQTGQIFLTSPPPRQTNRVLRQLTAWGVHLDPVEVEHSYHATPVVPAAMYRATVRLLEFFAAQLGVLANEIMLRQQTAEPGQITRAREYIGKNFQSALSLDAVAHQAGMSRFHFCRTFKRATGVHFTQYITRIRVEQAKSLLLNVNHRVSEIAFAVGFQSLTHFNRAFKNIAGQSPSEYRGQLAAA